MMAPPAPPAVLPRGLGGPPAVAPPAHIAATAVRDPAKNVATAGQSVWGPTASVGEVAKVADRPSSLIMV